MPRRAPHYRALVLPAAALLVLVLLVRPPDPTAALPLEWWRSIRPGARSSPSTAARLQHRHRHQHRHRQEQNRRAQQQQQEEEEQADRSDAADPKALKICDVLGGLDVTRLRSSSARSVFRGAIEDVELLREYLTEAATNGARSDFDVQSDLPSTLDYRIRNERFGTNLTESDTTLTAGLGWVDDREDRRMERFTSTSNGPFVGTKRTDSAMVDAASDVLPWLVDRRAREDSWHASHANGRSEAESMEPLPFDSLYMAGYVLSWGESLWYYPPLSAAYGHPLNMGDVQGGDFDSHEMVTPVFLPEALPGREAFFYGPYADMAADPGHAMITATSVMYYEGSFAGYDYDDNYIAHAGIDISLTAVSALFDDLEDALAPGSFAFLVHADTFHAIAISQSVVERIFPERTGFEADRLKDVQGDALEEDRRNVTYTVGDTIHQSLDDLPSADWAALHEAVRRAPKGGRGYEILDITTTGTDVAVPHYVMYDKWAHVSDWALLVAAPVDSVDGAVDVVLSEPSVDLEAERGETIVESVALTNRGTLDVVVKTDVERRPWIEFRGEAARELANGRVLRAGDTLEVEFAVKTDGLEPGTSHSTVSIHVRDDAYPDCFYGADATFDVTVRVTNEAEMNQLRSVVPAGLTLMAIVVCSSLAFAGCVVRNRDGRVVKSSQPLFLIMICFGTLVMGTAIVSLSVDDGNSTVRGCDVACVATPWLISMGFTVSFAALFSKIWRINKIFHNATRCRKIKVTERDVLVPFAVLFSLNFAVLLAWTLVDPPRWVRVPVDGDSSGWNTYGTCRSEGRASVAFVVLILVLNLGALILACAEAYRARSISDEYSESKYIAIGVASWLQVFIVGIPLMFLVDTNPTASYFLKSALIFVLCMSMLLLIFVPKLVFLRRQRKEKEDGEQTSTSKARVYKGGASSGGMTAYTSPVVSSPGARRTESGGGGRKNSTASASSDWSSRDHKASEPGLHIVQAPGQHGQDEQQELKSKLADSLERIRQLEERNGDLERMLNLKSEDASANSPVRGERTPGTPLSLHEDADPEDPEAAVEED